MSENQNWQAHMAMGMAALGRKDLDEAEHAFRAAVLVAGAPGPGNLQLPKTLDHLATTLQRLGRNEDARTQFTRMIAAQEAALGEDHLEVATSYGRLGLLEAALGDLASALEHQQRALKLRESQLGPLHPAVALSLNSLGYVHKLRLERTEAEASWMRALSIREVACGPEHPDTAESLLNLGNLYRELGRFEDGARVLSQALEILQRFPRDPRLHHTLALSGSLAQLRQAPEQLQQLEKLAVKIRDAARSETQADRDAANAVSDFLEYEEGNGDSALRLVLYRGGHVFLEERSRSGVRAWTARGFSAETFDRIASALGRGAFEMTVFPMPAPGEAPRRLNLRAARAEASARLPTSDGALSGEAKAIADLIEGIVRTVSQGKVAADAGEIAEKITGVKSVRVP